MCIGKGCREEVSRVCMYVHTFMERKSSHEEETAVRDHRLNACREERKVKVSKVSKEGIFAAVYLYNPPAARNPSSRMLRLLRNCCRNHS